MSKKVKFAKNCFYENKYNRNWLLKVNKVKMFPNDYYEIEGEWYTEKNGKKQNLNIKQTVIITEDSINNWRLV